METVRLGTTDLNCSRLGLGTWGIAGPNDISGEPIGWEPLPRQEIERVISAALEGGINFFDTSDFYGNGMAEEMLGAVLPPDNTNIVIATKGGILPDLTNNGSNLAHDFSPMHMEAAIDGSLRRLQRDAIDLYQLHSPELGAIGDDTWELLGRLKEKGKIRYIGVAVKTSRSDLRDIFALTNNPLISTIQVRYNLRHASQAARVDGADLKGRAVLARSVYEHGFLTGKYDPLHQFSTLDHRSRKFAPELADQVESFFSLVESYFPEFRDGRSLLPLQYALSSPNVSIAIVGATSEQQIEDNIKAAEMPQLSLNIRDRIHEIASETFWGAS